MHAEFKALPKFAEASAGFNARGAAGGQRAPGDRFLKYVHRHTRGWNDRSLCRVSAGTVEFKLQIVRVGETTSAGAALGPAIHFRCFERNDARGRDGALPYGLERASSHSDA